MDTTVARRALGGVAVIAWLLGAAPEGRAAPRFFGHYTGEAQVSTSPFHPPGTYPAEALVAQTESGIVGYVNIVYDPGDFLAGTVTHKFSAPLSGNATLLSLGYSDRLCGGGDPPDMCFPQGSVQYSFQGDALFYGTQLTLFQPRILPELPYEAVLPFDAVSLARSPTLPRATFEGLYRRLEYVWMGTIFLALPLPLFGTNRVLIEDGEIVAWWGDGGDPVPIPGVVSTWCFDETLGRGWMNQQGEWRYDWVLDPEGRGVGVIVTFASPAPDCDNLGDPLEGLRLDFVHHNLVGVMYEVGPPVTGPGAVSDLRLGRGVRGSIDLTWEADCGTGTAYAIYRGDLSAGYASIAPEPGFCTVPATSATVPLGAGDADFFLVVPNNGIGEGSYGIDTLGNRRPPAAQACFPAVPVDSCAP